MTRICPQKGCNNHKEDDMFNCWSCNTKIYHLTEKEEMEERSNYIKDREIIRGFGTKTKESTKGPIKFYFKKICLLLRILKVD